MSETRPQPLIRVHKGNPDDAELAALTAVLLGCAAAAPEPETPPNRGRNTAPWTSRTTSHIGPRSWHHRAG